MIFYIYPRKSKQNDNSESMEVQIAMCKDYIKEHYGNNNEIVIFDNDYGVTGHSLKNRNDFKKMMALVRQGIPDFVMIQRYDRIARNTRDFCNLFYDMEQNNCGLISVSQNIDTSTAYGRKFMYDLASTAELEWALCSERHRDVNRYAMLSGKCNLSPYALPFGYTAKIIDGVRRMVIDEDKRDQVIDMISYYKKSQSRPDTIKWFNKKYGYNYTVSILKTIINSPFFHGEYRENKNYCEPYFTPEEHLKIQAISKAKPRYHSEDIRYFLFSGLLNCPVCGCRLEPQSQISRYTDNRYYYYRCYNRIRNGRCTFSGNVNERKIESFLLDNISSIISEYSYNIVQDAKTSKNKIDKENIKKELERLTNAYIKGRITENYYDSEYERLTKEMEEEKQNEIPDSAKVFLDDKWKDVYISLSRKSKRDLWRSCIKSIKLDKNKKPFNLVFRDSI